MRWFVLSIPLFLAATLLLLGTPRLIGSLLKAPAQAAVRQIEAGQIPSPDQLGGAAAHLERALRWERSADLSAEIGYLRLLQASRLDNADSARPEAAALATARLRDSLVLSPARPDPWVRLAYARTIEGAQPREIVGLLDQSIRAGPYVGEVAIVRLRKLLADWRHLTPDLRRYAYRQIRWIWISEESYVLRAARTTSRPDIMRFALRPIPGAVERFDRAAPKPAD